MPGAPDFRRLRVTRPATPCIKLCVIDPASGLCRGCLRSLDEIAAWGGMTDDMRRVVMARLPERTARVGGG